MGTFALESRRTDWHFAKHLSLIVVAGNPLSDVADVLEVAFLAFFKGCTGVNPNHIAVIMGTKVRRLAEIVGTSGK